MVHDQSSTGSTLFIEPMAVIQLNNQLRELEIQEKKEIEAVLADLSNQTAPYTESILLNQQLLAKLDFIFAKAALSAITNAVNHSLTPMATSTSRTDATRY